MDFVAILIGVLVILLLCRSRVIESYSVEPTRKENVLKNIANLLASGRILNETTEKYITAVGETVSIEPGINNKTQTWDYYSNGAIALQGTNLCISVSYDSNERVNYLTLRQFNVNDKTQRWDIQGNTDVKGRIQSLNLNSNYKTNNRPLYIESGHYKDVPLHLQTEPDTDYQKFFFMTI